MAKTITVETTVHSIERLNNSVNGNPRWKLYTEDGPMVTQSDAAVGYQLDNHFNTRNEEKNLTGKPVRLSVTPAGRVWDIEKV